MTVDDIITGIIDREGRVYTNRAADKGGPTKFGITQKTLSKYRGRDVSIAEVQNLTEVEARQIYLQEYVVGPGFQRIANQHLQVQAIDWGVTSGADDPTKALQKLVGLAQDGVFGPKTAAAVNAYPNQAYLIDHLAIARAIFYARLVVASQGNMPNLLGWLNRALSFIE